jgi:hypothetical protein
MLAYVVVCETLPCTPLKVNRRFGGTFRLQLEVGEQAMQETSMKQVVSITLLIIRPWRWRWHVPPKRPLTFNGLHGVISQKMELFITTAVRTSNPTCLTTLIFLSSFVALDNRSSELLFTCITNSTGGGKALHCVITNSGFVDFFYISRPKWGGSKGRPARKAGNLTAICEPIV